MLAGCVVGVPLRAQTYRDTSPAIDPELVSRLAGRGRSDDPTDDLTKREREVLALMAEGRSNGCIADALVVTVTAVEHHISNIFAKLDLPPNPAEHRRVLAVLRYLGG